MKTQAIVACDMHVKTTVLMPAQGVHHVVVQLLRDEATALSGLHCLLT